MIRTARAHLNVEAHSHPGMTGKNNEDRYAVASFFPDEKDRTPVLFAVLADGIGGHRGGEVAAELAVNHVMQNIAQGDGRYSPRVIEQAVTEASESIAAHSATNENLKGMGATCAIVWIIGDKLHTAYVGDSRIYLIRSGRIQQLTVDHSWVQEAMEKGILTPEMAREHPNVHVIRRYLGSHIPPEPDFRLYLFDGEDSHRAEKNQGTELQPNDILLLCTDGLTDLVWNDEILEVVRSKSSLKEASRALIELANQRGGHDNITVVLIGVPSDIKVKAEPRRKARWIPWAIGTLTALIFILILASVLTSNLLRRNGTVTSTLAVSPSPVVTETPSSQPSATIIPSETLAPDVILPIAPTYTPWPTNTVKP